MKETGKIDTVASERQLHHVTHVPSQSHASPNSVDFRVMELELENLRLQRLVAELLLKNQQLRKHEEQGESELNSVNRVRAS
ncbi:MULTISPECIES: hypothetical protein [Acidobacteriaceae]|uniref:hypothetical protein n=1 Tax=Acidobacteriaceae TaxID=204434 RepID=UPI00131B9504|nr:MULTISPECIES: hypothetical protein [Acidobacteriaceae]MDW5265074.1 hypothetical protein [Edaphobacter sp.]